MSELQKQLAHLASATAVNTPLYNSTPSLFFNKKDAGSIDIDIVFDAAYRGLQALNQYDTRFATFFDNILHHSSQSVQRELLAPEESKLLNKRLSELFRLLTLFASEPSTHKVLEYLIRRYRVHELNVDSLIKCMLSQHDTKVRNNSRI